MRRLGVLVLAAMLPVAGFAQDAVIRIEAKRGEAAAGEAAATWQRQFDDVVTFPLPRGWIAIGLGPLSPEEAEARLADLKADGRIPADSFVAVPGDAVVLTPAAAPAAFDPDAAGAEGEAPEDEGADGDEAQPDASLGAGDAAAPVETAEPDASPEPAAAPPGRFIRLQSLQTEAEGRDALAAWRETFPEAGLWRLPNGWSTVALGPLEPAAADGWLTAFKASGDLPGDAFTSGSADIGTAIEAGSAPDLPAPAAEPVAMPPMDEVQRALRWVGRYDGEIDGKSGPQTREAIAAETAALRVSPDTGAAMQALIQKREAWRAEMGLTELRDESTGLSLIAPMDRLAFDRAERALSIYGPKDGSGAALILFSQPGGQQELLDLSGLVTALGWVPQPDRKIEEGHVLLQGENADHRGRAEGWVRGGRAEGFVLIWPAGDPQGQARIAAEMSDSLTRFGPAGNEAAAPQAVQP